ncbi:MAG: hypothetical protein JJ896_13150 [Rhodothermales bacterium]|nr:hypothetical protein [Rhodothermales bacterium]MBO6780593.1 hypothetical protein [Rhodothermales bacterium]
MLLRPPAGQAQSHLFGSLDDPLEVPAAAWWARTSHAEALSGLSLVGAQWRSAARLRARLVSRRAAAEIDGSFRAGIYGRYAPETDEPYDALRALSYARVQTEGAYLRAGTPTRTRMGSGLLVDFYHGGAAWDERSVGLEAALSGRLLGIRAMASDARLDALVSGRAELYLGRVTLGAGLTADRRLSLDAENAPTAREADLRVIAARSGGFTLEPFVSAAEFLRYGRGMMVGADLGTRNFIDLARFHVRLALQYAEDRFIPGYFGSFYEVHNPLAVIASGEGIGETEGVALADAAAATYLLSELRLMFFERFELWYAFRRHYGAAQRSTFHLRVFLRSERLLFAYGEDRGGLRSVFSLLDDVGLQSVMSFRVDYRLTGPLWMRVDARYGYTPLFESEGVTRYSVQRRFEPYVGLRATF